MARRDSSPRLSFEPSAWERSWLFLLPALLAFGSLAFSGALAMAPRAPSAPAAFALHFALVLLFLLFARLALGAFALPRAEVSESGLSLRSPIHSPALIPWERLRAREAPLSGAWILSDADAPETRYRAYPHWESYSGLLEAIRERSPGAFGPPSPPASPPK